MTLLNLSLVPGGQPHGTAYTRYERLLAKRILQTLLMMSQLNKETHEVDAEVQAYALSIVDNHSAIGSLARAVYKHFETLELQKEDTRKMFPKINKQEERVNREGSGVNLLFRGAMRESGFTLNEAELTFPSYRKRNTQEDEPSA